MSDSNVDWGQDLERLAGYLRSRRATEPVWLLYFGPAPAPKAYGIAYRDVRAAEPSEVRGLVAVSVTALNRVDGAPYRFIAGGRLVGRIGHSILLYELA